MMLVVVLVLLRPPQSPSEKAAGSWFAGRWKSRAASNRNVTRAVMALGSVALLHLAILPDLFRRSTICPIGQKWSFSWPSSHQWRYAESPIPTGMTPLAWMARDAIPWA
ncbi:MAG: hypothetical protein ABIV42_01420 [Nitrosospira sp.]